MRTSPEWITAAPRPAGRQAGDTSTSVSMQDPTPSAARSSSSSSSSSYGIPPHSRQQQQQQQQQVPAAAAAGAASSPESVHEHYEHHDGEAVVGHRGSGGLIRGRAVFCLPPDVEWFQGHFAYAARGGCTASLGVLGTELPVDPCMQCCHGGFSRYKLVFIHHESGKECTLIVERYGGNMMTLHAEASPDGDRDAGGPAQDSELAYQTHVMKADDDARGLLHRYFQSVVRAASDPRELEECIVCIGQMDVPLSLLQDLAAPLPDGSRTQSMVCSAFAPCREPSIGQQEQDHHQQQQQQQQQQSLNRRQSKNTPVLSPFPSEDSTSPKPIASLSSCRNALHGVSGAATRAREGTAERPGREVGGVYVSSGGGGQSINAGVGDEEDDDWL